MRNVEWLAARVEWLGGPPVGVGVIPWQCWKMPGFQDCHADQWRRARNRCDPNFGGRSDPYGTVGVCIDNFANQFAEEVCVPQFCATGTKLPSGMTYGETVSNPVTVAEQQEINAGLAQRGFQQITVDGKLGPRTCGAASVSGTGIPTPCFGHEGEWVRPGCVSGREFDSGTKTCVESDAPAPPAPTTCPQGQQLDVSTGQCRPISCPTGQQLDPVTGKCITPGPSASRKKKDNTGIILLGVAALIAGAFTLV